MKYPAASSPNLFIDEDGVTAYAQVAWWVWKLVDHRSMRIVFVRVVCGWMVGWECLYKINWLE
jgi:hypothetical protein